MTLLLKILCPDCGLQHDGVSLGSEVRCRRCGLDFRAQAESRGGTRIVSATPDELDSVPYSQRSVEMPVNKVSSVILSDPTLLTDKLLRDAPVKENTKWVGKVRLLKKIGQGGMGAVYRGYDESLLLDVAVKILPFPLDDSDHQFVERFRQEARISARINHPNVVRTLHVDQQGDLLFLVMDYIEGQTARDLVDAKGPLMLPLALQVIHDVTCGVQAAHAHGVVHRDIKPDNILVAADGRVLLSDLGLAKAGGGGSGSHMPVTRLGVLLGTPEYMSPEQWDIGAPVGPASDIWSIGATFWMLLTHLPPFNESDMPALAKSVKEALLPDIRQVRSDVPDSVALILERCLAKRPEDRFSGCGPLLDALDAALNELLRARVSFPVPKIIAEQRARAQAQAAAVAPVPVAVAPIAVTATALPPIAPLPVPLPPPPSPRRLAARVAWVALPFAAAAAGAFWMSRFNGEPKAKPAAVAQAVSLELRCSTRVKPGEEAELSAAVSGVEKSADYIVLWTAGDKAFSGSSIRVPLQHDTDFTVTVRDRNNGSEVARRDMKVCVDLQVRAAEKDFQRLESGQPLRLEGLLSGGASGPTAAELRWIDAAQPDAALARGLVLSLPEPALGRHTFVLQAKRKDQDGWALAATDKVVVEVVKHIPAEFKAAMQQALEARQNATRAATGAEAVALWRKALASLDQALVSLPDADDAKAQSAECRKDLATDEKYVALLEQARQSRETAEKVPESDGVRSLAAWSDAQRLYATALTLFDREEARTLAAAVQTKVTTLKAALEAAEQERDLFDNLITKARFSTKEAKKYVKAEVALPHWEAALTGFQELKQRFPKRADEFALELKEAQENRDQAYLYDSFGVVPAKAQDKGGEPKSKTPAPPQPTPPARPAQLPEPARPPTK